MEKIFDISIAGADSGHVFWIFAAIAATVIIAAIIVDVVVGLDGALATSSIVVAGFLFLLVVAGTLDSDSAEENRQIVVELKAVGFDNITIDKDNSFTASDKDGQFVFGFLREGGSNTYTVVIR